MVMRFGRKRRGVKNKLAYLQGSEHEAKAVVFPLRKNKGPTPAMWRAMCWALPTCRTTVWPLRLCRLTQIVEVIIFAVESKRLSKNLSKIML